VWLPLGQELSSSALPQGKAGGPSQGPGEGVLQQRLGCWVSVLAVSASDV
jgi:hypothetical protein